MGVAPVSSHHGGPGYAGGAILTLVDWWRRFRGKDPEPLTGAPALRRRKTYSGLSGYVYQYFYSGHRPARHAGAAASEYVFDVSADRRSSFSVSVLVLEAAVESWEERHRKLAANERYAIAKMALFGAFDERENPERMKEAVVVTVAEIGAILRSLDVE